MPDGRRPAHRLLHERSNRGLLRSGQLLQGEGGRPHGAFVEPRLVGEAERRVPGLELLRALEEADDLLASLLVAATPRADSCVSCFAGWVVKTPYPFASALMLLVNKDHNFGINTGVFFL